MSRRSSNTATAIELFPFLAVLVCAMGALILLLLAITQRVKEETIAEELRAAVERQSQQKTAAPSPVTTPPPEPPEVPVQSGPTADEILVENARLEAEWQQQLMEARTRVKELVAERDRAKRRLSAAENELSQLDQATGGVRERAAAIKAEQSKLAAGISSKQQEIAAVEEKLSLARRKIDLTKRKQASAPSKYALIPYDGTSGTVRRPIYIDCTDTAIKLVGTGVSLTPEDVNGFTEGFNPLLLAVQELVQLWMTSSDAKSGEPYLLLVVRPSGTVSFYLARQMLSRLQVPFGYELVDEDWQLDVPVEDPRITRRVRDVVRAALKERAVIAGGVSGPTSIEQLPDDPAGRTLTDEEMDADSASRRSGSGGIRTARRDGPDASSNSDPEVFELDAAGTEARGARAQAGSHLAGTAGSTSSGSARRTAGFAGTDVPDGRDGPDGSSRVEDDSPATAGAATLDGRLPSDRAEQADRATRSNAVAGRRGSGTPGPSNGNRNGAGSELAVANVRGTGDPNEVDLRPQPPGSKRRLVPVQPESNGIDGETNTRTEASDKSGDGVPAETGDEAPGAEAGGSTGAPTRSRSSVNRRRIATGPSSNRKSELASGERIPGEVDRIPTESGDWRQRDPRTASAAREASSPDTQSSASDVAADAGQSESPVPQGAQKAINRNSGKRSLAPPPANNGRATFAWNAGSDQDSIEKGVGQLQEQWGRHRPGTIGLEKRLTVRVSRNEISFGDDNLTLNIPDGVTRDELLGNVLSAISSETSSWGKPPRNYYWIPVVKFVVHPGGTQHYERLEDPLREMGVESSVEFEIDAAAAPRLRSTKQ